MHHPLACNGANELLVLVDERNRRRGCLEKLEVHRKGLLHRAFSVFLLKPDGSFLMQQRSVEKYHAGLMWANSCCGHPRPGERTSSAARRRVYEELGVACRPTLQFRSRYSCPLDGGMSENEYVYVYAAMLESEPSPDPREIAALTFLDFSRLEAFVERGSARIAPWLAHYLEHHRGAIRGMADKAREGLLT